MPADMADDQPENLTGVLDQLDENTHGDQVSIGDVIAAFDDRSFGALITAIGLVAAMPLVGAIPGVSIITGLLIVLVTAQYIVGLNAPYVPSLISERSIKEDTLKKGLEKSRPYAQWFDRYLKQRLTFVTGGPVRRRLIGVVVCLLAVTMVPLALVPWGVQAPATAIVLLGVALIARDGLIGSIGLALSALTAYLLYAFSGSVMQVLS